MHGGIAIHRSSFGAPISQDLNTMATGGRFLTYAAYWLIREAVAIPQAQELRGVTLMFGHRCAKALAHKLFRGQLTVPFSQVKL